MLNQLVLVGRLVEDPILEKNDDKNTFIITLAVPRSYKNLDGEYETDFIKCNLWKNIGETTAEYCKKGDLLGIKGHVESEDGSMVIIAEKVTFLSSKKSDN